MGKNVFSAAEEVLKALDHPGEVIYRGITVGVQDMKPIP